MGKIKPKQGIRAIVYPKQKKVLILDETGLLKTYAFKMDIPTKMIEKKVWKHDYGCWSVTDRDFESTEIVKEWDNDVIEKIKLEAIEIYTKALTINQP